MTTQVIFKIDKKLKEQAMEKARVDGLPFGSVLKLAIQAYVKGALGISLVAQPPLNTKTKKEVEQALKDIKAKKNLSPRFSNAKDAIAYLKQL
jgi:antitoxin component of RelBE/YafQ-DinJ toxin-antitoxin module